MGQVSSKLRRGEGRYFHWCPACEKMHPLPDSWKFDGDLENPSFRPSFKHSGKKTVKVDGKWTGEWVKDAQGKAVPYVCHYVLTKGVLNFCGDCTHDFAGRSVPLPVLPKGLQD